MECNTATVPVSQHKRRKCLIVFPGDILSANRSAVSCSVTFAWTQTNLIFSQPF